MGNLPLLLVGITAGAWMDHMPYRRVLITADVGRALLISSIPITAWLRVLSLTQLYVVAFLIGVLTVFFDVTYQSFLPSLVERDRLVSANSKLESGTALAGVIGPRLGGACRQLGVGSCGALLGGLLAEWSDLRTTMVVGTVDMLVAFIWLVLSPVRRVQSL